MQIIKASELVNSRGQHGKPILGVNKSVVGFSATTGNAIAEKFIQTDEDGKKFILVQFGIDEGQLYLQPVTNEPDAFKFILRANSRYELGNAALAKQIRELTGSEKQSVASLIQVNAPLNDWLPVITTYWKTQNR